MLGAIIGDIIGSAYEWNNTKTKDFPLISDNTRFTDDTVMTIAVADAMLDLIEGKYDAPHPENMRRAVIDKMKYWGRKYPKAGYGGRFREWLLSGEEPYNSYGNGSAMRVSSIPWLVDSLSDAREAASVQAAVTHNHPEGIKGAEAIASAIYLALDGEDKPNIKKYVTDEFGYNLDRKCDDIRETYEFDVSCQGSVPEAIIAFLEGESYEDVIRNAISLGGDSDTIAAMAGSIAEAYFGIPEEPFMEILEDHLPEEFFKVIVRFSDVLDEMHSFEE